jgi:hypothetical protein
VLQFNLEPARREQRPVKSGSLGHFIILIAIGILTSSLREIFYTNEPDPLGSIICSIIEEIRMARGCTKMMFELKEQHPPSVH